MTSKISFWLQKYKLHLVTLILTLPVLWSWLSLVGLAGRFSDSASTWQSLGQITGLIGLLWFSLALFLSARFRPLERCLGPLDQIYQFHRTLGEWSFLLLIVHPVTLIIFYVLAQPELLGRLIIPGQDLAITLGILALLAMIVLLSLTIFIKIKYHHWRATHQWMGLAFFLGGLHALLIPSDISADLFLRSYLLTIAGIALVFYLAYTVLNRVTVLRFAYRISRVDRLSENVVSLQFEPMSARLNVQAGQFIFVRFLLADHWSEAHPFSVTSAPDADHLSVSFKVLGDDTARFYQSLTSGIQVEVEGPFGRFGQAATGASQVVFVAGGIGITPFISLLQSLDSKQRVDVYYAVNQESEAVHLPTLKTIAATNTNIRIIPWFTNAQGYLSGQRINEQGSLLPGAQVFLCGPSPMMTAIKKQLKALGQPSRCLHNEQFSIN